MTEAIINPAALEPLFAPSAIPSHHRIRSKIQGAPAEIVKGRRPSPIIIAQNIRQAVSGWREAQYGGASDTTIELLNHWFNRDHETTDKFKQKNPFSYYFCQREAIETFIYLYEVRSIRTLSSLVAEFGGPESEIAALGINPEEDLWPKYAFKIATGAGKTKIMSLAIVWSYFHALRESDSPMTKNFVMIAPGITVFERLKEDFGNCRIFEKDPLILPEWRGDWNMSVVLQDEASGATTGGIIYLTNVHRLYDPSKKRSREPETYGFLGPSVSKSKALDTSKELRDRISSHPRLMLLNDESHHVWDPDSAWSEAILNLQEVTRKRGGGLIAQLDFSATPKDNKGQVFQHVVCDTPLGEAVDAGIVKTPIIGHGEKLITRAHSDAAYKYENHLTLGYKRWLASKEEWEKSGKKALLFVMTENTEQADQITRRLNTDPIYKELNGKTINLHTNLKGKLKRRGKGTNVYYEFIEDEKATSNEDLKELRKLSRELDDNTSPYSCIVSVLMLREGWDVRNVTTIIPLRPLTAKAKILPEQTLGRGLRRMNPAGTSSAAEVVTVVEHKAFINLYKEELSQEGLPIEIVDIEQVPKMTVTIYPDGEHKNLKELDLLIPQLSPGFTIQVDLGDLNFEQIQKSFNQQFKQLPLGKPKEEEINYEGRHLITDEIIEKMRIKLPLLSDGVGAISFFREELENTTRIRGQHSTLAPLIQRFIEEVVFTEKVKLYDSRVVPRLSHADVREHIRATFVPLILSKITHKKTRKTETSPVSVIYWKPFQATHSERHPTVNANKTPFNLIPCNNHLEVAMTKFLDFANDVQSFAKNAGPQALRIDFINIEGRRSIYTPDFLIRKIDGKYILCETKGRTDRDVPAKARAAAEWCKAACKSKADWEYLFVPQEVFEQIRGNSIDELISACKPTLALLLKEASSPQLLLIFETPEEERALAHLKPFIDVDKLQSLPSRYRKALEHSIALFHFHAKKKSLSFAPVFQPLLGSIDHAAEAVLLSYLSDDVPFEATSQKDFFEPDMSGIKESSAQYLAERARSLKRLLVHRSPIMPTGLLIDCLKYAKKESKPLPGIFLSVHSHFSGLVTHNLITLLEDYYNFRNTYVAHEKKELKDIEVTRDGLKTWVDTLVALHRAIH